MCILSPRPKQAIFILRNTESATHRHLYYVRVNYDPWLIKSTEYTCAPKEQCAELVDRCCMMVASDVPHASYVNLPWLRRGRWTHADTQLPKLVITKGENLPARRQHLRMNESTSHLCTLDHRYFQRLINSALTFITQLAIVIGAATENLPISRQE